MRAGVSQGLLKQLSEGVCSHRRVAREGWSRVSGPGTDPVPGAGANPNITALPRALIPKIAYRFSSCSQTEGANQQ